MHMYLAPKLIRKCSKATQYAITSMTLNYDLFRRFWCGAFVLRPVVCLGHVCEEFDVTNGQFERVHF